MIYSCAFDIFQIGVHMLLTLTLIAEGRAYPPPIILPPVAPNTTRNSMCPEMRTNHASQSECWRTVLCYPWVCWRMEHAYAALGM